MSNLSYKYILIRTILGEQKEAKEKFIHIPNSSKYIQFWLPAKMEAYVDTLRLLAQPKGGQQFKNKKQPELTENRTVRKSDNQGDKEETLTQTGR